MHTKIKNLFACTLFAGIISTSVVAQYNDSFTKKETEAFLSSKILELNSMDSLKNISFKDSNCTFLIEYQDRKIQAEIPRMFKWVDWLDNKNSKSRDTAAYLILVLKSSHKNKKAFKEIRNNTADINFSVLTISFDEANAMKEPNTKEEIQKAFEKLIRLCKDN